MEQKLCICYVKVFFILLYRHLDIFYVINSYDIRSYVASSFISHPTLGFISLHTANGFLDLLLYSDFVKKLSFDVQYIIPPVLVQKLTLTHFTFGLQG